MIKVIIVDDHKLFIDGVKSFLHFDEHIQVIGQAENGEDAIKLVKEKKPDVVLLDVHPQNMHGETVMNEMREIYPRLKILAVTMSDKDKDVQKMIHSGANGYVLKNKSKETLIFAIHQVHKGERYVPLELVIKTLSPPVKKAKLTKREIEILKLIKKGMTDKEIAARLSIEPTTVEAHTRNMRKKTKTHNRIELINYASEHDLL